jgi:peptide chain release factor subunit 1
MSNINSNYNNEDSEQQERIQRYKIKKLVHFLDNAKGMGTSVVTLLIPPGEQISKQIQHLTNELGTCSCIKSASNRKSVEDAITCAIGRLKLISKIPKNGLILYSGEVIIEDGKEKKLTLDIEPIKPVSRSMYKCDNRFDTEELKKMLENDDKFGFIIVDGTGAHYYTICGGTREKLTSYSVDLPKKHGRGGQSKNRFARIRQEKRHAYLRKVAEIATSVFITNDMPNVRGLILAGSAEFKETLFQSDLFDPRLKAVVAKVVDIQHSGDMGFNQAVDQSFDTLSGVKLIQEKKLLQKFFDEIAKDTFMYCYGVNDTMKCIEMGAMETIILYEDTNIMRYEIYDKNSPDVLQIAHHLTPEQYKKSNIMSKDTNTNINIKEYPLIEWITENYKKFGCSVEFVTDRSQEGSQFVKGFGGIGGFLRYKINLMELERATEEYLDKKEIIFDIDDDFM